VVKITGPVGEFDRVPARAGGHFGGERLQDAGNELAAARAHVDEGEFGGAAEGLVDELQQPGHSPREQRRRVH
jgi:hypothetical protein